MVYQLIFLLASIIGVLLLILLTSSNSIFSLTPGEETVLEKAQESLKRHENQSSSGQPIGIRLNESHFISHSGTGTSQVKVVVNYNVLEHSLVGQKINAVLKVYSLNGTLLKTSSFPFGFTVNSTGSRQFLTYIPNKTDQNVSAVVIFTDSAKMSPISNKLKFSLKLGQSIIY